MPHVRPAASFTESSGVNRMPTLPFKAAWMGVLGTTVAIHRGYCHAFAPAPAPAPAPATQIVVPPSTPRRNSLPLSSFSSSFSLSASSAVDERPASPNGTIIPLVPSLSLEEFLAAPVYDRPTLIRDIISSDQLETIAEELMTRMGDVEVQMQRKIRGDIDDNDIDEKVDGITEIYDVTLQEAAEHMMESYHDDSFFAFCDGLLDDKSDDDNCAALSSRLSNIRETPFRGENWFDYFPPAIRPTDAVILAGEGSCSTLHRDPFEWTGTSICLEGTKIWRFIIPNEEDGEGGVSKVDDALESYRLDSIAWTTTDEKKDPLILSRGWQSNLFFFKERAGEIPSAWELSELEEINTKAYMADIEAMGTDVSLLSPDEKISDLLQRNNFNFATAIQREGDLLIIPAHCWHQTYAPVPSLAIASQRCGAEVDGRNVVQHILESLSNTHVGSGRPPDILHGRSGYHEGDGKKVVNALVQYLSSLS